MAPDLPQGPRRLELAGTATGELESVPHVARIPHYFVGGYGYATSKVCGRAGCGRPPLDPIHLRPGDDAEAQMAVQATMKRAAAIKGRVRGQ